MAISRVKLFGIYLFALAIRVLDFICSIFGYEIFEINHTNLLHGLTQDEIKEASDPLVSKPLNLYLKGFKMGHKMDVRVRFGLLVTLKHVLQSRVEITRALQDYPDIKQIPVTRPVVIIGFPRTGTTLLYSLLAQDPQFRSPMMWEMMSPTHPGRPDNWQECERFTQVQERLEMSPFMPVSNDFNTVHALVACNPEECFYSLTRCFVQYHYHLRLPQFQEAADWFYNLTKDELVDIFKYHKKTLQLIGYKDLLKHQLLLKSHLYLLNLEAMLEVFPDACLIFTYRKMTDILPSFASMVHKATYEYGPVDKDYNKRVIRCISEFANRATEVMKKLDSLPKNQQPFFKIGYESLIKDPITTIQAIYDQYKIPFTADVEQRMRAWLSINPQHKHGRHNYSLHEYGLSEEDIESSMKPYLDYFKDQAPNLL